jgi:hypothetical protein
LEIRRGKRVLGMNNAYEKGFYENYLKCFKQGCKNFPFIHNPPQNSRCQEGDDMKEVLPYEV